MLCHAKEVASDIEIKMFTLLHVCKEELDLRFCRPPELSVAHFFNADFRRIQHFGYGDSVELAQNPVLDMLNIIQISKIMWSVNSKDSSQKIVRLENRTFW